MRPLTVGDMMSSELITVKPGDTLDVVRDSMYTRHIRHIPVVDDHDHVVGLISHRDLLRSTLIERPHGSKYIEDSILEEVTAEQVMTTALETATPQTDLRDAARVMLGQKLGCLPVIEDGKLVGILTEADFLRVVLYED